MNTSVPITQTPPLRQKIVRERLYVTGVVQGVGFRPFVYGLALRYELAGFVGNDGGGVFIEIEGDVASIAAFYEALIEECPPAAFIEDVQSVRIEPVGATGFVIIESRPAPRTHTLVSPDLSICPDCLRELFDPSDRRYRYPFINCTNCGPRFTIIRAMPYDRPATTMDSFEMCPACAHEYHDPADRRFHAQPIACPDCGPQMTYRLSRHVDGDIHGGDAIRAAQIALRTGQIIAVKGLGGYHLACDATSPAVVALLRERKGRGAKPFAVMVNDLDAARALAHINAAQADLLNSRARPIVLLRKQATSPLAEGIAPGNPHVGVMLAYKPLHYLLLDDPALPPLVMTSGNLSNEPIITDDADALDRLAGIADAFLLHDRAIHVPCDDSVVRVFDGAELPLRRSRGYAPFPVQLPVDVPPILGVGGEIKNTFCLAADRHAILSQHIGDMEHLESLNAFDAALKHMRALFHIEPRAVACDLHPGYFSSRRAAYIAQHEAVPLVKVQHHHAHIAALMAEHGVKFGQPVIGFAFDGTGYGTDGAIWGGEGLITTYAKFQRAAHLAYIPLPGGDAAIRHPYRAALAHLWAAGLPWDADLPPVIACGDGECAVLRKMMDSGLNCIPTSSMGRLFDAVAALIGVRQSVTHEGQAAIELEGLARSVRDEAAAYVFDVTRDEAGTLIISPGPVLRRILHDRRKGVSAVVMARRFHLAVSDVVLSISRELRDQHELNTVALSGGVFQNTLLLRLTCDQLRAHGFDVLTHRIVPPNDAGIALGQVMIAARQLKDGSI